MKKLILAVALLLAGGASAPIAHAGIPGLFGGLADRVTTALKKLGSQGRARLLHVLKKARDKVAAVASKEAKASRRATRKLHKEADQAAGGLFFLARKLPKPAQAPALKKATQDATKLRGDAAAKAAKLAAEAHARTRDLVGKAREELLKLLRREIKAGKGVFRALKGLALPAKIPALRFLSRR